MKAKVSLAIEIHNIIGALKTVREEYDTTGMWNQIENLVCLQRDAERLLEWLEEENI